jgi:hypothetical protein
MLQYRMENKVFYLFILFFSKKSIKLYWSEICQNCRGKKIREIHLGQSQLQRPRVFAAEVQLYVRFFLTPKDTKHCCIFLPWVKAEYRKLKCKKIYAGPPSAYRPIRARLASQWEAGLKHISIIWIPERRRGEIVWVNPSSKCASCHTHPYACKCFREGICVWWNNK